MTKVAILIDGGYLLRRLPAVRPDIEITDAVSVAASIEQLVRRHLDQLNEIYKAPHHLQLLYRCFYYDAKPYNEKAHKPIGKQPVDYAKSDQALFRNRLFECLRNRPNFAVRLGEVRMDKDRRWMLKADKQKQLLDGKIELRELVDEDFIPALRQKGVDMRIGLDIASITLKRQADTIVLVAGDADFVPAAKLARREGTRFILDPLWQKVSPDLFEHIDLLRSGFFKPTAQPGTRRAKNE